MIPSLIIHLKNGKFILADYSKQIIQPPLGSTVKPAKWVMLGHWVWISTTAIGERV